MSEVTVHKWNEWCCRPPLLKYKLNWVTVFWQHDKMFFRKLRSNDDMIVKLKRFQ